MIIGSADCDTLPKYGKMIVKKDGYTKQYSVPFLTPETIQEQVQEWAVAMAIQKTF
jgi:hypothetical protein